MKTTLSGVFVTWRSIPVLTICELADLGEEAEVAVKSVSQGPPDLKLPFYSGGEFEVQINGFENGLQIKIVETIEVSDRKSVV